MGILLNNMNFPSRMLKTFCRMTIDGDTTVHRPHITPTHDLVTELVFVTELNFLNEFKEVLIEHMKRLKHADVECLLLARPISDSHLCYC